MQLKNRRFQENWITNQRIKRKKSNWIISPLLIWELSRLLMNNVLWMSLSNVSAGNRCCLMVTVPADKIMSYIASFRSDTCRHGISAFPCSTWCWICSVTSSGMLVKTRQKFSLKWVHNFSRLKILEQIF